MRFMRYAKVAMAKQHDGRSDAGKRGAIGPPGPAGPAGPKMKSAEVLALVYDQFHEIRKQLNLQLQRTGQLQGATRSDPRVSKTARETPLALRRSRASRTCHNGLNITTSLLRVTLVMTCDHPRRST